MSRRLHSSKKKQRSHAQPAVAQSPLSRLQIVLLLVAMLLVLAPHWQRLPLWLSLIGVAVLCWRGLAWWRRWPMPGRFIRLIVAVTGLVAVAFSYGSVSGETFGVALLVTMLTLKLCESDTVRDLKVLSLFALFALAAQSIYSQSLLQFASVAAGLLGLLALQLTLASRDLTSLLALRSAAWLMLQAAPIAVLLFVLFPRLPGPLWGIDLSDGSHTVGLSDRIRLGDVSRLAQSSAVAFRVEWQGEQPARNELYWRGPLLWVFDGVEWRQGREPRPLPDEIVLPLNTLLAENSTATLEYEVILPAHQQRWLFALDMLDIQSFQQDDAFAESRKAVVSSQLQLLAEANVVEAMRYRGRSFVSDRLPLQPSAADVKAALKLPAASNPKSQALGREWAAENSGNAAIVDTALNWYRQQPFAYTLEPSPLGEQQVDDFLFKTQNGFCGHFASSFAVLMRSAGVPTRLVAGYLGGEKNPLGDYMLVRQSDAHVWAEVWLPGIGWQRIDPTAEAAPQRLESSLNEVLPQQARVPGLRRLNASWFGKAQLSMDWANYHWQRWVLGYDGKQQRRWLQRLHPWFGEIGSLLMLCGLLLAAIGLLASSWLLWRNIQRPKKRIERLWLMLQKRIAKRGLEQRQSEHAEAFMKRAADGWPAEHAQLLQLAKDYNRLRYSAISEEQSRAEAAEFVERLKQLSLPRLPSQRKWIGRLTKKSSIRIVK